MVIAEPSSRSKKGAGAAGAPLRRQGNGIPVVTALGSRCFGQCSGSALSAKGEPMGESAALPSEDTRQSLLSVVAGPEDHRGTPVVL